MYFVVALLANGERKIRIAETMSKARDLEDDIGFNYEVKEIRVYSGEEIK